jgi:iron-sulfur cluster assembly accessory protein
MISLSPSLARRAGIWHVANMTDVAEAVVNLTENAAREIKARLAADPAGAGKGLRLYVEQGGCSGLQYGMTFDGKRDGDLTATSFGASILVDAFSANYLRGAVVDFSDALTGGGFKISNPNAAQSCGCGKSFATEQTPPGHA